MCSLNGLFQSPARNYFRLSTVVPSRKTHFPVDWRPLVEGQCIDLSILPKKKLKFLYIFFKKKLQVFPGPFSKFQFCIFLLLKIYGNINLLGKIDWSMNSGRRWAGES